MSSKRRVRRNGCTGKVRYKSLPEAMVVKRALKARGEEHINVYLCELLTGRYPRHYHIGHTMNRSRAFVP